MRFIWDVGKANTFCQPDKELAFELSISKKGIYFKPVFIWFYLFMWFGFKQRRNNGPDFN